MKIIHIHLLVIAYLCSYNLSAIADKPLEGQVSNDIPLCKLQPRLDPNGKPLIGVVKHDFIRGFIGVRYEYETGKLLYIYPESDLNHYGIQVGDYILKIEKEAYRPCLMPNSSLYQKDYILNLTIKGKNGVIRTIPVKLIDARNIIGGS